MENQDYLWDRTGRDPEIEELEDRLSVFRLGTNGPPLVPSTRPEKAGSRFSLRFAIASLSTGIAAVIVAGFVFFWVLAPDNALEDVALAREPGKVAPNPIPQAPAVVQPVIRKTLARVRTRRRPLVRDAVRVVTPKTFRRPGPEQVAALTSEEKEAYDKLMLALSVTSSSLKLVQDKVNTLGPESPEEKNIKSRSNK